MKDINRSWRAQKGTRVHYAKDRVSGEAVVLRVLDSGWDTGLYLIQDLTTQETYEVNRQQIRLSKTS